MANHYQLLDPLRLEEYAALKADIQKRGVLVPVELDEDGNILDGHNRVAIAAELGIDYPRIARSFETEAEKHDHILKINLLRRHIGDIAWAKAFRQLAEVRGVPLDAGPGRHSANSSTVGLLASELGIKRSRAFARLALAAELADTPDLAVKVDAGEMTPKRALRVKRERQAQKTMAEPTVIATPPMIDIRQGDFREVLADIAPGSVDMILTDPPYPAEYLPLWSDLARFAARVLKPGRLIVAYSGQYHLPEVMQSLAEHLQYVWLGGLLTPGQHNQVQQRHIRSAMKPLLFYSCGPYQPDRWFDDAYASEAREKDNHDWEQSIGAASYYIERLSAMDGLVVDPFLGSGTTALAALRTGRRFIGSDVDGAALATAGRRLAE